MLAKLQEINMMISQARDQAYLCKYDTAQKMFKKILEIIRQEMILNNFNRRDIQTWKVAEKSVMD